jgi:type IV pilus assembly protein PilQ
MRHFIIVVTTFIVTLSLFAQFALTASAPAHSNAISPQVRQILSEARGRSGRPLVRAPRVAVIPATDANFAGEQSAFVTNVAAEEVALVGPDLSDASDLTAFDLFTPPALPTVFAKQADTNFCDPKFVGDTFTFSQNIATSLDDLLIQIHNRFGVNFITGPDVGNLPINVKTDNVPWTTILRSQLFVLGVQATCVDGNTVQLIKNDDITELEQNKRNASKLETRYIKLKYIQPSSSSNKNVAGQSSSGSSSNGGGNSANGGGQSGNCDQVSQSGSGQGGGGQTNIPQRCKFERLMTEVRQILGLNDTNIQIVEPGTDPNTGKAAAYTGYRPRRPYVGQVPGRNMLLVHANAGQLDEIAELIRHADVPPFQVVIRSLIYTANEDKLKDIGAQTTITDTGGGNPAGGLFGHTAGGLGTLLDFSTMIGSVEFNLKVNALQRDGVISIKSRPFATVLDGDTTALTVGRQVPVLIQAVNPIGGAPGTLEILQAANLLSVTPHVIDDENGNPTAVNLELQLESNDVDTSVESQGVPAISVRSIQSNFIINQEQTAILGGFTVDSDSRTVQRTPGLADIPILGELFKRRIRATQINRLYFAISVSVIPYGGVIEPVVVPGADPAPPTLTPELLRRSQRGEPLQVATPAKTGP